MEIQHQHLDIPILYASKDVSFDVTIAISVCENNSISRGSFMRCKLCNCLVHAVPWYLCSQTHPVNESLSCDVMMY